MKILFTIPLIVLLIFVSPVSAEDTNLSELRVFLENDKTDENEYLPWYTCGHFTRDLARNSNELNIGSAIIGNHPVFAGYNNHALNYVYINGELLFIEPQTDGLYYATMSEYRYVRLYPDGTQVPSHWRHNLAHDIDLYQYYNSVTKRVDRCEPYPVLSPMRARK